MELQTILVEQQDAVLRVSMNRPDMMNALNRRMRQELTYTLTNLSDGVRCVVLTGEGRGFCSGQDLTDASAAIDLERTLRDEYEPMLRAITDCEVPVIAAVNGVAAGAGANIALVCDVVIATQSASFIQAFTRIGLIPDAGGTWYIPRAIGAARAMGAMLFAEPVTASEAADWGMIWQAVADEDFAAVVMARATQLSQGPTSAYRSIRKAVAASFGNDLHHQLQLEAELQGKAGQSSDFTEGVGAFLQKRKPNFTGH
ncbi:enoyl-CoA hydratase-related protein [Paracoccus sp. 1_MG-2023]|uniref:enoyl-CoA hydratase-related protein n=1 Tax=unclassified Paracoccus (in: a-proteobacteria) TaxID=2688777 RepID=UPI001C080349|nr:MULTISPECIES: enoyl-CoA hydratase-related protein [unclassified Paracoccus (in: a-proteobacteria)]MBU2956759.1 enoyl-CoA hydratase/isomerase family protein [Paracoccus sp. C2R09]MDO6669202.1 enoyl-CoA hydratase-related protein [Paracoccus sp. 1_MG-2023]